MNDDFLDLLRALQSAGARFLVVGAHAMAVHGVPRSTGDLAVWVSPEAENAIRVWEALDAFAPVADLGMSLDDLRRPKVVLQLGVPPRRIDLLTGLDALTFAAAWESRVEHQVGPLLVPFLGRADLIRNKKATGRPKDLADAEALDS